MPYIDANSNLGDAVTGERVFPGDRVFDTGLRNVKTPWLSRGKTRVVKEETIVWLAEQAGYSLVKRDAGDFGDAEGVDAGDVESGGGEVEAGKVKAGGRKSAKRGSDGPVEGE